MKHLNRITFLILFILFAIPSYSQVPPFTRTLSFASAGTQPTGVGYSVSGLSLNYYAIQWVWNGQTLPSACTATLEISGDANTWTASAITGTCTTNGISLATQLSANYIRVKISTLTPASSGNLVIVITGWAANPVADFSGSISIGAVTVTSGHIITDTGSVMALTAGSAVIGHVINDASSAVIGHVIVDSGGGTSAVNTWASGTLGAMANYGTSPGAVLVPGVNSFVTNTVTVHNDGSIGSSSAITSWGGGTLGAMATYGTSPGAVLVPGTNAFITNLTTDSADNAAFTEAPVGFGGMYAVTPADHTDGDKATILTDIKGHTIVVGTGTFATQSAITAGSSSFSSGAFSSGAFASGALASGSVASGAIASGAVASGAYSAGSYAVGAIPPSPGALIKGAGVALTTTASISVISAVTSNYLYIRQCVVSNATDTATDIILQDGSGGTTLYHLIAPARATATDIGGATFTFTDPIKVTTSGNALYAANVTSTTTKISCSGFASTVSY